ILELANGDDAIATAAQRLLYVDLINDLSKPLLVRKGDLLGTLTRKLPDILTTDKWLEYHDAEAAGRLDRVTSKLLRLGGASRMGDVVDAILQLRDGPQAWA